jgi:hypothetical protein
VTLVLDTGAFVAVERADRGVVALIKAERLAGRAPISHGGVVGQVWRGGAGRQANLARLLAGVRVVPLDDGLGRQVGVLLGRTGGTDVIDAGVVLLARDDDMVLTSDTGDLTALAAATGVHVELVAV